MSGKRFTKEDDDYIMNNHGIISNADIGKAIGRSAGSICKRYKVLAEMEKIRNQYKDIVDEYGPKECEKPLVSEDTPMKKPGRILTFVKTNSGDKCLLNGKVTMMSEYGIMDYLKMRYDTSAGSRSSMCDIISELADQYIYLTYDELIDALEYGNELDGRIIRAGLGSIYPKDDLDAICDIAAERLGKSLPSCSDKFANDTAEMDKPDLLKTNVIDILTSGNLDARSIGNTVTLSNSAIDCQEWIIADINHGGTENTIDLFPVTTLTNDAMKFDDEFSMYENSLLDNYLEDVVYDGFDSRIKDLLCPIDIELHNGKVISRHVVAPSLTELGATNKYAFSDGNAYYDMLAERGRAYKTPNGSAAAYWTRTYDNNHAGNVFACENSSFIGRYYCDNSNYVVAHIRLKTK